VVDVAKVTSAWRGAQPAVAAAQIELASGGRWHASPGVLRDELATQQRALVQQVLSMPGALPMPRSELAGPRRCLAALHAVDAQRAGGAEDARLSDGSVAVQRLSQLASRG
jgi:glutamate dehydrogenase